MATFELYRDGPHTFRWRFCHPNRRVIAESAESFKDKSACDASIALVKLFAREANVIDQTQPPTPTE